jgi:hypothetical protein
MPSIYITSNGPTGTKYGRFPLQQDDQGLFVVLPGGIFGVKVKLAPERITIGSAVGADYLYELPVSYTQSET